MDPIFQKKTTCRADFRPLNGRCKANAAKTITQDEILLAFIVEVEAEKRSTERIKSLPIHVLRMTNDPGFQQPLELGMTDW